MLSNLMYTWLQLKHLYTAITRARVRVVIYDEDAANRAPLFYYLERCVCVCLSACLCLCLWLRRCVCVCVGVSVCSLVHHWRDFTDNYSSIRNRRNRKQNRKFDRCPSMKIGTEPTTCLTDKGEKETGPTDWRRPISRKVLYEYTVHTQSITKRLIK